MSRWEDIEKLLRPGGYAFEGWEGGPEVFERLKTFKVLVLGAGGLGCEILKNLALSGFQDIHVIDLDTIDLSNLNRQFLFRNEDVGKPKADVAAKFVMDRCPGVKVTPHFCPLETFGAEFYREFSLVISGLDSIGARRWLNFMLLSLIDTDEKGNIINPSQLIPFIDGGTEGFMGQIRVMLPRMWSCFECQMDLFPPQQKFPLCTIAHTPRNADHCVEYVLVKIWETERPFPGKCDGDNPEHVDWVFEKAKERAASFGIEGVTRMLTQGIIKNIIPAIASTNAIVASACCNEAFKILTESSQFLQNYMMYNGRTTFTHTFEYQRKPDCIACSITTQNIEISPSLTLNQLIEKMKKVHQLKSPSIRCGGKTILFSGALASSTEHNLEKTCEELFQNGDELGISDPSTPSLILKIKFI